jgi:hypothetical protein
VMKHCRRWGQQLLACCVDAAAAAAPSQHLVSLDCLQVLAAATAVQLHLQPALQHSQVHEGAVNILQAQTQLYMQLTRGAVSTNTYG